MEIYFVRVALCTMYKVATTLIKMASASDKLAATDSGNIDYIDESNVTEESSAEAKITSENSASTKNDKVLYEAFKSGLGESMALLHKMSDTKRSKAIGALKTLISIKEDESKDVNETSDVQLPTEEIDSVVKTESVDIVKTANTIRLDPVTGEFGDVMEEEEVVTTYDILEDGEFADGDIVMVTEESDWQTTEEVDAIVEASVDSQTYLPKGATAYACKYCNKVCVGKYALTAHERVHTGEAPYDCPVCHKKFNILTNMRRHLTEVHSEVKPFPCSRCSESFMQKAQLRAHDAVVHKVKQDVPISDSGQFQCTICNKLFSTAQYLRQHMVLHEGDKPYCCSHCNKQFAFKNNLERHMKIHTGERPFWCQICDKGFIEKKSLANHNLREHKLKPQQGGVITVTDYQCQVCGRYLANKSTLKTHMLIHTQEKQYSCSYCSRAFSLKANMLRHERTHRGEKPFACDTCGRCFTEKKSCVIHQRIHTGERPYKCTTCDKSFAQLTTLKSHLPMHHRQRRFQCNLCHKAFLRRSHLEYHMVKHGQNAELHNCSDCNHAFRRKSDLERHRLVHSEEKPYACTHCQKQFSRPQYLREHMNFHLGRKPYKCRYCALQFRDGHSLWQHQRQHPEEEERIEKLGAGVTIVQDATAESEDAENSDSPGSEALVKYVDEEGNDLDEETVKLIQMGKHEDNEVISYGVDSEVVVEDGVKQQMDVAEDEGETAAQMVAEDQEEEEDVDQLSTERGLFVIPKNAPQNLLSQLDAAVAQMGVVLDADSLIEVTAHTGTLDGVEVPSWAVAVTLGEDKSHYELVLMEASEAADA